MRHFLVLVKLLLVVLGADRSPNDLVFVSDANRDKRDSLRSEMITNIFFDGFRTYISTNRITNWITIEEIWDKTPAELAVATQDQIKQVGTVQTNRIVVVIECLDQQIVSSNTFTLTVLSKDAWPSQTRTLSVPASHRPFVNPWGGLFVAP